MTELQTHFMAHPLLADWLSAIGCQAEDIEKVYIAHDIERDKEREEKHYDGWKHWKYGKEVTFTITMNNGKVHRRNFERTLFYGQNEREVLEIAKDIDERIQ